MKLSKAIKICLEYHRNHSKPNTVRSYEAILTKFGLIFGDKDPVDEPPSNEDVNRINRQLLLVTDNEEIPMTFIKFFDYSGEGFCSPANRGLYINLLRKDLGKRKLKTPNEIIPYFRSSN